MTKMTDNQLDQLFREKASGHTMNPAIESWQAIAAKTAVNQAVLLKKAGLLWKLLSIGLATTLVSTVAVYEWADFNKEQQLAETIQTQQPLPVVESQTPIADRAQVNSTEPVNNAVNQQINSVTGQSTETHQVNKPHKTESHENKSLVSNISKEKRIIAEKSNQKPQNNQSVPSIAIANNDAAKTIPLETIQAITTESNEAQIADKKEPTDVNDAGLSQQETIATKKVVVNDSKSTATIDPSSPGHIKSVEAEQETKSGSRFFVSAITNYGISHRMVGGIAKLHLIPSEKEKPGAAIGGGVHVGVKLNDRWELRTGASWQRLSQNISIAYKELDPKEPELTYIATSAGAVLVPSISKDMTLIGKQNFSYLHVPLLADYNFGNNKTKLALTFGPGMNFLLQHKMALATMKGDDKYIVNDIKGLRKTHMDFSAGLTLKRAITQRWELTAGPMFRCAVLPASNKDWEVKYRPWSAVLNLGLNYNF